MIGFRTMVIVCNVPLQPFSHLWLWVGMGSPCTGMGIGMPGIGTAGIPAGITPPGKGAGIEAAAGTACTGAGALASMPHAAG